MSAPASPLAVPEQALRAALGRFTTGVTIITCLDGAGLPIGLTANSFSALSLDPSLVLWSLRRASATLSVFQAARHFAINVLAESQVDLSRRFASSVPGKFDAGQWSAGLGGAPVLGGCAAVFECEPFAQHDAGDHVLFIGNVLRVAQSNAAPLVYQAGHYRLLGDIV